MGGPDVASAAPAYTKDDLKSAYSSLLKDLNDAYWAAADLTAKDQIYANIETVTSVLSQLNAADLQARNSQYTALSQQVATVNKALTELQQQINTIISRISTAATIASDITKVLDIATKVIPFV
jgi:chromosome segregation ATPase